MTGYVANTDHDWFDFLRRRPEPWDEVNFWNPSDRAAFRGSPGAPFFFRLKAPRNVIGGFGLVSMYTALPEWLAWECFGEANGAATLGHLTTRLARLRGANQIKAARDGGPPQIGCILLSQPVFFPEHLWVRQPADWSAPIVRYKSYALQEGEGARVWRECQERAAMLGVSYLALAKGVAEPMQESLFGERYGSPVLVRPRLGQGTFRVAVTDAYRRACAVTGEHSLPVLEAAHIQPYAQYGRHEVSNGLLLRSDLHRLFDTGYVTVTPDHAIEVSTRLREDYQNGRTYYPLHGQRITVPERIDWRPDPHLLAWHNEQVFRG